MIDDNKAGDGLFPPGFTYRPPIETVCMCGKKHTGNGYCPRCENAIATDFNMKRETL